MDTQNHVKPKILINVALVVLAYAISIICVVTGAGTHSGSGIEIGVPAMQKYKAPRRVENIVQTERNRQVALEMANRLAPVTEFNPLAYEAVKASLDEFFARVLELRRQQTPIFTPYGDESSAAEHNELSLNTSGTELLLTLDTMRYSTFVEQLYTVTEEMMDRGIMELDARALISVKDEMDKLDLSQDLKNLGYQILIQYLVPNVTVNEEATKRARDERAQEYETVYLQQDQVIVDEGHIITPEAYAVLEELGYVRETGVGFYIYLAGTILLVAAVFALTLFYIGVYSQSLNLGRKETMFIFSVFSVVVLVTRVLETMPYQFVPILFCTFLVAMIIDSRLAISINLCIMVVCYLITGDDYRFLLFYSISGAAVGLISNYMTDRGKIIISSLVCSLVNLFLFAVITLLFDKKYSADLMRNSLLAAVSGMMTVILGFGSLPIWEALFGVVTAVKLVDLTNPNSALLRRMTLEAPGTYHHSLIVANLAETAAFDIGANSNLARAGAYYHDIGKLKYPQYFIENQAGENLHDLLDPQSSAQVIFSHVTYGLELAAQHKLPKVIRDFIHQHHGNSLIAYFYAKAVSLNPEGSVREEDYKYNNPIPQFKECAIVMLADGVEAGVRSMVPSEKSVEEIEAFVRRVINSNLESGQMMDSGLTIKDIETITKSFMRVFMAMYHKRIPYPGNKKKKEEPKIRINEALPDGDG